jgi:hypothetical protein
MVHWSNADEASWGKWKHVKPPEIHLQVEGVMKDYQHQSHHGNNLLKV